MPTKCLLFSAAGFFVLNFFLIQSKYDLVQPVYHRTFKLSMGQKGDEIAFVEPYFFAIGN